MSAGVKIYDKDGRLVMGPTTAVGSILGMVETGGVNGSITDPRFALGHPRIFAALPAGADTVAFTQLPLFTISGNTISWSYSTFYKTNVRLLYGIS